MRKPLLLLLSMATLGGCSPGSIPTTLPPGATFEMYTITDAKSASTVRAVDPGTGEPLYLQTPPIITTSDVATVARLPNETRGGAGREAALNVELTPVGSAKMASATATPKDKPIAVVINGQIVCTPRLHSPITNGSFQISGAARLTSAMDALAKP